MAEKLCFGLGGGLGLDMLGFVGWLDSKHPLTFGMGYPYVGYSELFILSSIIQRQEDHKEADAGDLTVQPTRFGCSPCMKSPTESV